MNVPGWFGLEGVTAQVDAIKPVVAGLTLDLSTLTPNALMLAAFFDKVPEGAAKDELFKAVAALIVQALPGSIGSSPESQPKGYRTQMNTPLV